MPKKYKSVIPETFPPLYSGRDLDDSQGLKIEPDAEIVEADEPPAFFEGPDAYNTRLRSKRAVDKVIPSAGPMRRYGMEALDDPRAADDAGRWVDMQGLAGAYQVEQDTGLVRGVKRDLARSRGCLPARIIRPFYAGNGYWGVKFSLYGARYSFYLHKVFAQLWPPLPKGYKWKRNWDETFLPTPHDMVQVPTARHLRKVKDAQPIFYVPPYLRNGNEVQFGSHVGTEEVGND